jgi:hypothetical protein
MIIGAVDTALTNKVIPPIRGKVYCLGNHWKANIFIKGTIETSLKDSCKQEVNKTYV